MPSLFHNYSLERLIHQYTSARVEKRRMVRAEADKKGEANEASTKRRAAENEKNTTVTVKSTVGG